MTTGWKLDSAQRDDLLARYPPRYAEVVADHVTLLSNEVGDATADRPAPVADARIVGRADDGAGVWKQWSLRSPVRRAARWSAWHVTWSLAEGRAAKKTTR